MAYHSIQYFVLFLPLVMLLYSLFPKKKRWAVLLAASLAFEWMFSSFMIVFNLVVVAISYTAGRLMEGQKPKKKKKIMYVSLLLELICLIVLKYSDFFVFSGYSLLTGLGLEMGDYNHIKFIVPIGISYYTLQGISYIVDVKRKKIAPSHDIFKLALYLSFFPQIMEGPITRYDEVADRLCDGHDLTYSDICQGYQRILYGLFKKVVIADRMNVAVETVFARGDYYGALSFLGAILCTIQLYMDFSGTIDIAIGSGKVLGVSMAENFKQPFFADNASDFWHRWHITLGTWFKDYIFYPVSLSSFVTKQAKACKKSNKAWLATYITAFWSLICVWLSNGLWHGPKWTYILYGVYYFLIIFLEYMLEPKFKKFLNKHKWSPKSPGVRAFRFIKLCLIVIVGEMFFKADTWSQGFAMFKSFFANPELGRLFSDISGLGLDIYDYPILLFSLLLVLAISIMKEKKANIRSKIESMPLLCRWAFWYAAVFVVIIFGAYGPGFDAVAMMYATF